MLCLVALDWLCILWVGFCLFHLLGGFGIVLIAFDHYLIDCFSIVAHCHQMVSNGNDCLLVGGDCFWGLVGASNYLLELAGAVYF